ncbi:carbohydrate binding family 9 domain-containing protein [bacterium]|nr:carbohydrate binding family 9 domain-containing protein [bacterium]
MKKQLTIYLFTFLTTIVFQSSFAFTPNQNLEINIVKFSQKPIIDGNLNDSVWENSNKMGNFCEIEPNDNTKPEVDTEAFLGYDDENLYIAFKCYDNDVSKIRASITNRDGMFNDDWAGIILDTFYDKQNAYEFLVNPHGIQGDLKRINNDEEASFNAVWKSESKITENGWETEIAIPFKSLRFSNSEGQKWGIHFLRNRPRNSREQYSWAPSSLENPCFLCLAGTVKNIEKIEIGKNIEILPYVIGTQTGSLEDTDDASSKFKNEKIKGNAGLDVKYGLTPNLTLDATVNPDFSQVEADAAQVNVNTTFALFFPERRPFFLEGANIFQTMSRIVYTRSLNDPSVATKLTGKIGKYSVGYIFAKDEKTPFFLPFEEESQSVETNEVSYSNIFRVKRDLFEDSFFGLIVTDRRFNSNASNNNFGVDTRLKFSNKYKFEALLAGSYTKELNDSLLSENIDSLTFKKGKYNSLFDGEDFFGRAFKSSFSRSAKHWNYFLWYDDFSPTYRADNGFVSSNSFRQGGFWTGYSIRPQNSFVVYLEPQLDCGRKYNYEGKFKDTWIIPQVFVRFKKQTTLFVDYLESKERFNGVLVKGIRRTSGNTETKFSKIMTLGISWRFGTSVVREDSTRLGFEKTFAAWSTLQPTQRLNLNLNYDFYKLNESLNGEKIEQGYIFRTKTTYQFTRELFLRLVCQYDSFSKAISVDPLLSYQINPFSLFYLGSTHYSNDFGSKIGFKESERQFFLKFQYLFRV